jgi:uncharacterized protein YdeI (BOF family)
MRLLLGVFAALLIGAAMMTGATAQPATAGLEMSGFNGPFGEPTVSFAADMYYETGKNMLEGRLLRVPQRQRWEFRTGGVTIISIIYTDNWVGYTVLPAQKMYLEVDHAAQPPGSGTWSVKRTGEDTADGLVRGRYDTQGTSPNGDSYQLTMWLAEAYNLVVEVRGTATIQGVARPIHFKLYNIAIGPQNPALFEPPSDYKRFGTGLDANSPTASPKREVKP